MMIQYLFIGVNTLDLYIHLDTIHNSLTAFRTAFSTAIVKAQLLSMGIGENAVRCLSFLR